MSIRLSQVRPTVHSFGEPPSLFHVPTSQVLPAAFPFACAEVHGHRLGVDCVRMNTSVPFVCGSPGTDKGWAWDAREWAIEPGDEGGDVLPFDDEQPAAPSSSGASGDSATTAAELHGADLLMCCA